MERDWLRALANASPAGEVAGRLGTMHGALFVTAVAPAADTSGPAWTDVLTAVGTVVAGFAAAAGLLIAIRSANYERKHAEARLVRQTKEADERLTRELNAAQEQFQQERAAADERFQQERAAADKRSQLELEVETDRRTKQRRVEAAASLLRHVAGVMVRVDTLWGARHLSSPFYGHGYIVLTDRGETEAALCLRAVEALRHGAYTDARLIGDKPLADRYRTFLKLVLTVTHGELDDLMERNQGWKDRTTGDLRNYGKFVMISLQRFIDGETLPQPGQSDPFPLLTRNVNGNEQWEPSDDTDLREWSDESDLDPADPRFKPAK